MNKTILITGASSGIGKETAKLFQSKGWNVIATMRNPENETELKQLENVLVAKLDVLELDSIKKRLKMVFKNLEMLMYCLIMLRSIWTIRSF
jgi:NADP-dependent 3-hydroxy acid dehydrogenase YdfG